MDSDFIKGINKAIDAATGEVGGDYTYNNHTDVTDALDKLAAVIAAGGGADIRFEIYDELPQTGEFGVIYLIPNSNLIVQNIYDEYIWIENSGFELIGNTAIDLDEYVTDQELEDALNNYVEKISGKGLSTNDFTDALLNKLNGIEANAEANVQADWTESDPTSDAYIANKPDIPSGQVNADWNAVSGVAQILNKPTIPAAQVNADWDAVSGVAQILNKPTIPDAQVNSDWEALSGVSEILNKPTIPSALSDLTDDPTHRTVTDANKTAWDSKMDAIELTQAEYDALTPAQKSNGKFYCITDSVSDGILMLNNINYSGSGGSGTVNSINDIGDVSITQPLYTNQVLKYSEELGKWVNGVDRGAHYFNDLIDCHLTSPADGQLLKYDATNGYWKNVAETHPLPYTEATGTLLAGESTVTISDSSIKGNSTIDVYVHPQNSKVAYTDISVSSGSVTLTYPAQTSNMEIKVRIS